MIINERRGKNMSTENQRDLVLPPNNFAFILDNTKGNVNVLVGPKKEALSTSDVPVIFNETTKEFDAVSVDRAIQKAIVVPEGWYVKLKNPARENEHPIAGNKCDIPRLSVGQKINLHGPVSFALYPMQMADVIRGHRLAHNQYLLCRVYNGAAVSISDAVVETAKTVTPEDGATTEKEVSKSTAIKTGTATPKHRTGEMFIIRGDEVSFYIPPTGIEVVQNSECNYVRNAITLENLEYCMLRDESGQKRYVQGPDVVFPKPTEAFILNSTNKARYKAIELNEQMGIYVRVIEDYDDHEKGDELFITGKEIAIYFPRKEHAIITYGKNKIHYAIAIPKGEARYVMSRGTGEVRSVEGPKMFLPNPIEDVIVKRILTPSEVTLMYPNNNTAAAYNGKLVDALEDSEDLSSGYVTQNAVDRYASASCAGDSTGSSAYFSATMGNDQLLSKSGRGVSYSGNLQGKRFSKPSDAEFADEMDRETSFTKPREITLNTKYDGAVTVDVWNNYAIQLIAKDGQRTIVEGPCTVLLGYDQTLGSVSLSTGMPKTSSYTKRSGFLRIRDNRVRDNLIVETNDFVEISVDLTYLIDFRGKSDTWFNVDNYVQLICDRVRAMVRNAAKKMTATNFYTNADDIIRSVVLRAEGSDAIGRMFDENGMFVYDVEVRSIDILNNNLGQNLKQSALSLVDSQLQLKMKEANNVTQLKMLELEEKSAEITKKLRGVKLDLDLDGVKLSQELEIAEIDRNTAVRVEREGDAIEEEKHQVIISTSKLERAQAEFVQLFSHKKDESTLGMEVAKADSANRVKEVQAFSDKIQASLQAIAETGKLDAFAKLIPMGFIENQNMGTAMMGILKDIGFTGGLGDLKALTEANKTGTDSV